MKSLVEEALARESAAATPFGPTVGSSRTISQQSSSADAELLDLLQKLKTNIKIIGCGGGGSNTINRIAQEGISGAELYAANTDAQHLLAVRAPHKILLGRRSTRGLGAGALPKVGEESAMEAEEELRKALLDANIVFVTAGMGGGTGTGSAPFVAKIAKDIGALTIAVTTIPFRGEGKMRMENAEWGLDRLRNNADTVIVIPNDRLLELCPRLSINAAFKVADEVLMRAVKGITELITVPGLVNLDFADVRAIMEKGGVAMIGMGESDAQDKSADSVRKAIRSPLLDIDISCATSALVNVTGGPDMTMAEAEGVVEEVYALIDPDARIIWGAQIDPTMQNTIRTLLILTGVRSPQIYGRNEKNNPKFQRHFEIDFLK